MGIPDFYWLLFAKDYVFTVRTFPQVWRLVTNFLITGPKLGMILDPYFLYTYCSSLEMTASRFSQPGDFLVYLVFVNLIILVSGRPDCPCKTLCPASTPLHTNLLSAHAVAL